MVGLKHGDLSLVRAGIRLLTLGISTYVMADCEITEAARTRTGGNIASFLFEPSIRWKDIEKKEKTNLRTTF